MSDVSERSAVYNCRSMLKRLNQIGSDGILEECGHSTDCLNITCSNGISVKIISYDYS